MIKSIHNTDLDTNILEHCQWNLHNNKGEKSQSHIMQKVKRCYTKTKFTSHVSRVNITDKQDWEIAWCVNGVNKIKKTWLLHLSNWKTILKYEHIEHQCVTRGNQQSLN